MVRADDLMQYNTGGRMGWQQCHGWEGGGGGKTVEAVGVESEAERRGG